MDDIEIPREDLSAQAIEDLVMCGQIVDEITRQELLLVKHVSRARMRGASWRMVGVALGTSTQAAWQRFRPDDAPPVLPGQGGLPFG